MWWLLSVLGLVWWIWPASAPYQQRQLPPVIPLDDEDLEDLYDARERRRRGPK